MLHLFRRSVLTGVAAAAALAAGLAVTAPAATAETTLRIVPHSNLAILDPIWTTAYMSRNHGYMIYDTLFGTDEKSRSSRRWWRAGRRSDEQPRHLHPARRAALHDGAPVTAENASPRSTAGARGRDGPEADDLRRQP